jgi:hypothetical protein
MKERNSGGEPHQTPNAHPIEVKDIEGDLPYMVSLIHGHAGHVGRTLTAACYQYQTEDSKRQSTYRTGLRIRGSNDACTPQLVALLLLGSMLVRAFATRTLTGVILSCRAWRLSSSPPLPLRHRVLAMMDRFMVRGGAATLLGSRESQCSRWLGKLKDWD